ncbi:MAG TPA: NAD(P)H-dependent glycerol-3-phosphate dehydrogenase [Candidatus Acidoferrum sp.]|jgi:glycerol-3-phosphate dehydrogenase (NAD(P)+)
MKKIAVLGAGSWGTALAIVLARSRQPHSLSLWAHDPELAESLGRERENRTYLPGQKLAAQVEVTNDLATAMSGAQFVVGAIPSAYARKVYGLARPYWHSEMIVVSATKGLEPISHARMSEVIYDVLGDAAAARVAILSGPSFALEAARGEPTAVVVAGRPVLELTRVVGRHYADPAGEVQAEFAGPGFRLYTNNDVLGVELAGAMKNVIAIAAGVCNGLGLGANSLAALITRGLAEMARLAARLGAKPETMSGLAGLGDLVLTCTGALSRNRHIGIELGKGRDLNEILSQMKMVAEGVGTTAALLTLATEANVELPITEQVNAILHEGKSPAYAIRDVMERPSKRE